MGLSEFGKGILTTLSGIMCAAFIWVFWIHPYIYIGDQPMKPKLEQKTYTYFICHEEVMAGPDLRHSYSLGDAEDFAESFFEDPKSPYIEIYWAIFKNNHESDWGSLSRPLAIQRRLTAYGYHVERVEYSEAEALKAEETPVWEWDKGNKKWIPRMETVTL